MKRRELIYAGAGLLAGLIPFITLCVMAPGFWGAYLEKIPDFTTMLFQGKTNVPYAIIWPWQIPSALGSYFVLLPFIALTAFAIASLSSSPMRAILFFP